MTDGRRFLLTAVYAAWAMVFVYAFVAYARAPHDATVYLGWQGVAGMLAVAVFGIGLGWPRGTSVRGVTAVPLIVALLHLLAIAGVTIWAGEA